MILSQSPSERAPSAASCTTTSSLSMADCPLLRIPRLSGMPNLTCLSTKSSRYYTRPSRQQATRSESKEVQRRYVLPSRDDPNTSKDESFPGELEKVQAAQITICSRMALPIGAKKMLRGPCALLLNSQASHGS